MKNYDERLSKLEARHVSEDYLRRAEEFRNSPRYKAIAELIQSMSPGEKAEALKRLREKVHAAGYANVC